MLHMSYLDFPNQTGLYLCVTPSETSWFYDAIYVEDVRGRLHAVSSSGAMWPIGPHDALWLGPFQLPDGTIS